MITFIDEARKKTGAAADVLYIGSSACFKRFIVRDAMNRAGSVAKKFKYIVLHNKIRAK
ncbi:MAG: hypothetical protein RSD27_10435 [Ruthenibacterium sp.]